MSNWTDYLIEVTCSKCGETRSVYKYNFAKRDTDLCRKCFLETKTEESTVTLTCSTCGKQKTTLKSEAKSWITGECVTCASKRSIKLATKARLAQASGVTHNHDGYVLVKCKGHPMAKARDYALEHWKVVFDIAGDVADPQKGHQIHHVDGNPKNNSPNNLVVCQDNAYHSLLHTRAKAFYGCGDVNKRQCYVCKEFDDPSNMTQQGSRGGSYWHKKCVNQKRREAKKLEREQDAA